MISGTYWGEIEVLKQIPRLDTTMAPVDWDLFVMSKELLDGVCCEFPSIANEMRELADMREVFNAKAKEGIVGMIKSNMQIETEEFSPEIGQINPEPTNEELYFRAKDLNARFRDLDEKSTLLTE